MKKSPSQLSPSGLDCRVLFYVGTTSVNFPARLYVTGNRRTGIVKKLTGRIRRANHYFLSRWFYNPLTDEARKYVDELQCEHQERLDGLNQLEIARTGPVKHVGTIFVLAPDADTQAQLPDLHDELDPNIRRQSEIATEDRVNEVATSAL